MKRLLLITHHFPPDNAVGAVRPAKFAKYLPQFGWDPIVLTVKETYHGSRGSLDSLRGQLPWPVIRTRFFRNPSHYYRALKRTFVGDSARVGSAQVRASAHENSKGVSIREWLNVLLAFPDEDTGWIPFALVQGIRAIRRNHVNCIMTSGPPHSAHLIGAWLSRATGLPWIVDLRDPVHLTDHPGHRGLVRQRLQRKLEASIISRASLILTTTKRLSAELASRYPSQANKVQTLQNGYDPDDFAGVSQQPAVKFTIAYLGTLYLSRDPEPVLRAVAALIADGVIDRDRVALTFAGDCEYAAGKSVRAMAAAYGLESVVELLPWLPKQRAFEMMVGSHVLLLLAEHQALMIPAKVYDYLGTGRHILALTQDGATSDLLRETGNAAVHLPDDEAGIKKSIGLLYERYLDARDLPGAAALPDGINRLSRQRLAGDLARFLTLCSETTSPEDAASSQPARPRETME